MNPHKNKILIPNLLFNNQIKNLALLNMLKIFRNIRRNYLFKGKNSSYLKYAIGEIFLVVVGILIALQINNWNETRKKTISEHQILKTIKRSLVNDTLMFQGAAKNAQSSNEAIKYLLTKPPFSDTLTATFVRALSATTIQANTSAFEQLKSLGLEMVKNDSLRDHLVKHYDFNLVRGIFRNKNNLGDFNANVFYPFYRKHLFFTSSDTTFQDLKYLPKDFDELIKNQEFVSLLLEKWLYNTQTADDIIANLNQQTTALIKAIDIELNSK